MQIDTSDREMYLVAWYGEFNILTNVLKALALYKREVGGWPRMVGIRKGNRLQFGFGEETEIKSTDWMVLEALYLSTYDPYPSVALSREPTLFKGKRKAILVEGLYRSRNDGKS